MIVCIEDDKNIRDMLDYGLSSLGLNVKTFEKGKDFFESNIKPNLILLDLMLPGENGDDILKKIRKNSNVPVIVITAKNSEIDKIKLFNLGADDYIVKPFSIMELNARINAILRRYNITNKSEDILEFLDFKVYKELYTIKRNNEEIILTKKEFLILVYLLENKNITIKREKLLDIVWGIDYIGESRTLDVHIASLRSKLRIDCIKTIRGIGYKFEVKNEV